MKDTPSLSRVQFYMKVGSKEVFINGIQLHILNNDNSAALYITEQLHLLFLFVFKLVVLFKCLVCIEHSIGYMLSGGLWVYWK